MGTRMDRRDAFRMGFDHGNYAAAYKNVQWASEALIAERDERIATRTFDVRQHWVAGFVLGVYSSYELHEVPETELPLLLAAVRFTTELQLPEYRDISAEERLAAADTSLGLLCVPED